MGPKVKADVQVGLVISSRRALGYGPVAGDPESEVVLTCLALTWQSTETVESQSRGSSKRSGVCRLMRTTQRGHIWSTSSPDWSRRLPCRARGDRRALWRPGCDGDRLPAEPHPGRVHALGASRARWDPAPHPVQHPPGRSSRPNLKRKRTVLRHAAGEAASPKRPGRPRRAQCRQDAAPLFRLNETATNGATSLTPSWTPSDAAPWGQISDAFFKVGGPYRPNACLNPLFFWSNS